MSDPVAAIKAALKTNARARCIQPYRPHAKTTLLQLATSYRRVLCVMNNAGCIDYLAYLNTFSKPAFLVGNPSDSKILKTIQRTEDIAHAMAQDESIMFVTPRFLDRFEVALKWYDVAPLDLAIVDAGRQPLNAPHGQQHDGVVEQRVGGSRPAMQHDGHESGMLLSLGNVAKRTAFLVAAKASKDFGPVAFEQSITEGVRAAESDGVMHFNDEGDAESALRHFRCEHGRLPNLMRNKANPIVDVDWIVIERQLKLQGISLAEIVEWIVEENRYQFATASMCARANAFMDFSSVVQ